MSVHETLGKIGLNEKEIKVYTTLLKTGRLTPAGISRITKINRATVYNISRSLVGKGFVSEDLGGKTLYLSPVPPESLHKITERSKRELEEKDKLLKKAISELSLMAASKTYPIPKIRFVGEGDLEEFLYDNFIKWNDELMRTDGTWWGFQDHSIIDYYREWIEWIIGLKEYHNPKIKARLLSNASPTEQKLEKKVPRSKRDIRLVPGMNFTSTIWVVGDYLIMVSTREHPYYLVEIHDNTLAHNMRETFKKLWELTGK